MTATCGDTAAVDHYLDAELSDGVVTLRPLRPADAADHLAGEDAELVRWLNGGPGTPETVLAHLQRVGAMWAAGGPIFGFGIRAAPDDVLAGTLDVQMHQPYAREGQANLAFGLYPVWRGRGLATRAVLLGMEFLRGRTSIDQALIRVDPANRASSAVARRAGFQHARTVHEACGELAWFTRNVR